MRLVKIPKERLEHMKSLGFNELDPYTHKNPLVKWLFWKRLETMLDLARESKASRVLDFGAGSGILMPSLSKNFKEVYSLDLNTKSLEYVKKDNNLSNVVITKGTGEDKLPYEDNFFDIVFAADVLEHLQDSIRIQKEFKRVLKRNGLLIISGPTENLIYKIARRAIYWFWKKKEDHFSNIDEIIGKSRKLFKVEEIKVLPFALIPGFKVYRAKNE